MAEASDFQGELAEIFARVEQVQHLREGIHPALAHILAELQPALRDPLRQVGKGDGVFAGGVEDDEAVFDESSFEGTAR